MKKIILLSVLLTIVLSSCSSAEKKAHRLIKQYLKENLHDTRSYESISFGTLDTVYTTYLETDEYEALLDSIKSNNKRHKDYSNLSDRYRIYRMYDHARACLDTALMLSADNRAMLDLIESRMEEFVGVPSALTMFHTYRASNALGAQRKGGSQFYFDLALTEITEVDDDL